MTLISCFDRFSQVVYRCIGMKTDISGLLQSFLLMNEEPREFFVESLEQQCHPCFFLLQVPSF